MKCDRVALWLECLSEGEPARQPSPKKIRRWLDQRVRECVLAMNCMKGLYCIAADEDLECRCGTDAYTDDEPCPKCFAEEMYEMCRDVLKSPKKRKKKCKRSGRKSKAAD